MDLGLRDRTYVVTGASRGLGYATAHALSDDGARVVLSSRKLESVVAAAAGIGGGAIGVEADNADPAAAERLIEVALRETGRIDGLLVSVGGPPAATFAETTDEQWRSAFETILLGTIRLLRTVGARLGPDGAMAVVLSSSVRSPLPRLTLSNAFRPALAMLVKQLADELGPNGVRVVGLVPGRIATERTAEVDGNDPDARRRSEQMIPLRRLGAPEEFGRVAAFVLSPAASYLTGMIVTVDGGMIRAL